MKTKPQKNNITTLSQEDIEIVKDVISDCMNNLEETILAGIAVNLRIKFNKDKLEDVLKLAEKLVDMS